MSKRLLTWVGGAGLNYATRWGVQSFWNLEDTADAAGTNTLTNNAGVTFGAGKVGNAAYFARASSQSLSRASNAGLQTGDVDFWAAGWVYQETAPADMGVLQKTSEYTLYWFAGRYRWDITSAGAEATVLYSSTGAWAFVMAYHDSVNDVKGISLDGGAFATTATGGTAPTAGASAVTLGVYGTAFLDGRMDSWAFGKSPPGGIAAVRDEIRDTLYNAGAGRTWPIA